MSPFDRLIGQPQAVALLTQAIAKNRIAPAYLFVGPEGIGRSLAARCFAEAIFSQTLAPAKQATLRSRIDQGNHPDLMWVEPTYMIQGKRVTVTAATAAGEKPKTPPIIRLDQIREIGQFVARSTLEGPRSLVILAQANAMAEAAANALLKTLEEPGQATLILLAPTVDSLLPTLVSRCQRIPFQRLSQAQMQQVLTQTDHADLLAQPEILTLAEGSPGAAIAHWQQQQAIAPDLLQHLSQRPRNHRQALTLAQQLSRELSLEAQLWLIGYLQQRYWRSSDRPNPAPSDLAPLHLLEQARSYLLQNVNSRLVWEVTLMKMVL